MSTSSPKKSQQRKPAASASIAALEAMGPDIEFIDRQTEEERLYRVFQPGRLSEAPEEALGKRIQESREAMRLTQGDLAKLTKSLDAEEKGLSRGVISMYEAEKNRPSPREIRLLCEALRVTPNYLIYGKDDPFDNLSDQERLGTNTRSDPEGFAWMAYVMASIHHNHYDAVMKLVLDLARGWNTTFDQGIQDKANAMLIDMAERLQALQAKRASKP